MKTEFKRFFEEVPFAMVIIDREGHIVMVNTETEKLFGFKREELLNKKVEILIPKRFHSTHPAQRDNYFDNPRVRPIESDLTLFGQHKNGKEFPVEISLSPVETEAGLLALAAIRDITKRKAIEETQGMLCAIIEYSDDAIIGKDLNGIVTSWNKSAEKLFGFKAREIIGKSISSLMSPAHSEGLKDILKKVGAGVAIEPYQTERIRKDGTIIPISITISPIKKEGIIIGASSFTMSSVSFPSSVSLAVICELSATKPKLSMPKYRSRYFSLDIFSASSFVH